MVIKREGLPDELRHISVAPMSLQEARAAGGIFDLNELGFPPPLAVDSEYAQGFSRTVIRKVGWVGLVSRVLSCFNASLT